MVPSLKISSDNINALEQLSISSKMYVYFFSKMGPSCKNWIPSLFHNKSLMVNFHVWNLLEKRRETSKSSWNLAVKARIYVPESLFCLLCCSFRLLLILQLKFSKLYDLNFLAGLHWTDCFAGLKLVNANVYPIQNIPLSLVLFLSLALPLCYTHTHTHTHTHTALA